MPADTCTYSLRTSMGNNSANGRPIKSALLAIALAWLPYSFDVQAQAQQPAHTTPPDITRVNMAGQSFELVDAQGGCVLVHPDNTRTTLDMNWPCSFSTDRKGEARVEMFRSMPIVLVINLQRPQPTSNDCTSIVQPVRLRDGVVEKADIIRTLMCAKGVVDQKMYVAMFDW